MKVAATSPNAVLLQMTTHFRALTHRTLSKNRGARDFSVDQFHFEPWMILDVYCLGLVLLTLKQPVLRGRRYPLFVRALNDFCAFPFVEGR